MDDIRSYGYTAQATRGTIEYTYRPLVDVEVGSVTQSGTFKALIDSGSEITILDTSIAELLGISSEGKREGKLSGIGEWRSGFIAPVSLKISRFPDKVFDFEVLFVEDVGENFDIILGQQDFFRNFNVTFKRQENLFYLERV